MCIINVIHMLSRVILLLGITNMAQKNLSDSPKYFIRQVVKNVDGEEQ